MARSPIFGNGVPTEPDVVALTQRFGVPVEGQPIAYQEVADAIRVPVRSCRFRTVTQAWRKSLRAAHGIILAARNSEFVVRDPSSRVMLGKSKTHSGVRCFAEAIDIVVGTDRGRLTEKEKADSDKVQRVASLAQSAALAEARKRPAPTLRAVGESNK